MGEDPLKMLVDICQQMLDGKVGVIVASRKINDLAFRAFTQYNMPSELKPFIGIDSEAGNIPLGPERRHWSAKALLEKDVELTRLEKQYHDLAFKTGRKVIECYKRTII